MTLDVARRVTIIAGTGGLVGEVLQAATARGDTLQVLALAPRRELEGIDVTPVSLERPMEIISKIVEFRPSLVVLAGAVSLTPGGREVLARFSGSAASVSGSVGDVSLSRIAHVIETLTGATLAGVHEIAPELLTPEGHIAGPAIDDAEREACQFAINAAREIGRLDLGQAVVVSGRHLLAAEDIAGTDALLTRIALYRERGLLSGGTRPMILAKACKPDQPLFVDMPAIGPATIENAAAAGVSILALQAGRTLMIGKAEVIATANARRITVTGLDPTHG